MQKTFLNKFRVLMQDQALPLRFDPSIPDAIDAFKQQQDHIMSAVFERIRSGVVDPELPADDGRLRLALESARILAENIYVCSKYGLPGALDEYLAWLRGFLSTRNFPSTFIPRLLHAMQISTHAFVALPAGDTVSGLLRELRRRETAIGAGEPSA